MQTRRGPWLIAIVAGVVAAVAAAVARQRRGDLDDELFTDEPVAPMSLAVERSGAPIDRGNRAAYALDVDRLRDQQGFEPVVEYLTFIQSKRGDGSHLLFVRYDDLDVLARQEGEQVTSFLQRLDQLGVVVSNN